MQHKWIHAVVLAGAMVAVPLLAQNISEDEFRWGSRPYFPQPTNAIRVESNLVQVGVVVRDSKGKAIAGLQQSDFQLFDNGKPVKISSFSFENSPGTLVPTAALPEVVNTSQPPPAPPPPLTPRYIALFFDDFSMTMSDLVYARKAAEGFVRTSLKPGDKIAIFTSSTEVSLNFTENVPKLLETIGKILSHAKKPGLGNCPRIDPYLAYQIDHNDTDALSFGIAVAIDQCPELAGLGPQLKNIVESAARETLALGDSYGRDTLGILRDVIQYLKTAHGKRMLVLTSSGFWTRSPGAQLDLDKLIGTALDANVIVNSLDAKGLVVDWTDPAEGRPLSGALALRGWSYASAERYALDDSMALLAAGTGGQFFHNRNDLDVGLRDMVAAPNVSYTLAFSPEGLKRNGALHNLKVKLANSSGLSIEARKGYLAPSPELSDPEKKRRKLDSAVLGTAEQLGIPARVTTETGALSNGEAVLKVGFHVDVSKLPFQDFGGRKADRLIFVTALFDEQNHFLTGVEGVMDLRIKKETMPTVSTQGLDAKLSLQAPRGKYRLRQVVEEIGNGRITAMSRPVEIR